MAVNPRTGTTGNDTIEGPYDRIDGLAGHDWLGSTFGGRIYVDGGDGNDLLYAREEFGSWGEFFGRAGNDFIEGGSTLNVDTIYGGTGDDALIGGFIGDGADLIFGEAGRDELVGNRGNDSLFGGDGDESGADSFAGPAAPAWKTVPGLFGKEGDDYLDGGAGNDWLEGGEGRDVLVGGIGADSMIGGDGDDTYLIDHAADVISETAHTGDRYRPGLRGLPPSNQSGTWFSAERRCAAPGTG